MGPIATKSIKHSADIRGDHNTVWFLNEAKFDVSAIFNQTFQNAIERLENIIVANNSSIILNLMLILTFIIIPIVLLHL